MSDEEKSAGVAGAAPAGFSIGRVLTMLFVIAAVGGIGYLGVESVSGPPAKYPFRGQVLFNGQPVTVGAVMTQLEGNPLDLAIGALDADGRFVLTSDGQERVSEGTHLVSVSSMASGMPPRPLVPDRYLNHRTSPLRITVTSDPAANEIVFELEGELTAPAPLAGPPGAAGGGGPSGGGPPVEGAAGDAAGANEAGDGSPASGDPAGETEPTESSDPGAG